MAHELTHRADGFVEMGYAIGVDRWHGLGNELRDGATIEEWQVAAGMDWVIRRTPAQYYADRAGTDLRTWDDKHILVRSDSKLPLGMVSPDYNIVQPYEVLEFFRDLVADRGFKLETAGTLFGGSQFWALAKVTEAVLSGWDKVGGYVLINTSADGTKATSVRDTTVCVVCNNTLSMAVNAKSKKVVNVSHRNNFDPKKVQEQMGLTADNFSTFIEAANKLTTVKVTDAASEDFVLRLLRGASKDATLAAQVTEASVATGDTLTQLLAGPYIPKDDAQQRRPRGADTILALFNGAGMGSTEVGRQGTAWGLVNAVTEYVDHWSTAKTDSHRLSRAMFGDGDSIKTLALAAALEQLS